MSNLSLKSVENLTHTGQLKISITSLATTAPITDATITISFSGDPEATVEKVNTDNSGQTDLIDLPAPALEYSLEPQEIQPYSEYTLSVTAPGYEPVVISGTQILPDVKALQSITLTPTKAEDTYKDIIIPAHTLYGEYPPKIPEAEIKPVAESGEIVLSKVVIPEYVIVHDGTPDDSSATNYYVKYKDYIKNVASSEIYATWPENTIYANILAIMSFTLNRVYTEWYRNKGYNFTITSSTAFDQKWMYERNIFENINFLVDSIFANFLSRPGIRQPILTSYCDGDRVSCKGLSQWGSKNLGDEGYRAIDIIHYYYGSDMYINSAEAISGVPASYPGYVLTVGSSGQKVQQLQEQLNQIAKNYPAIPTVAADGIYGDKTATAVKTFQNIFSLPATGDTDYPTWYAISDIFVAVSRIAEPGQ